MFKPKVYKSNGLEAYHLINDEGGSFLYEGDVEYSEGELFKDEQGRAYYLVTTAIGGTSRYYVEVEPEGRPIPKATSHKEKDISELIMASPRENSEKPVEAPMPAPAQPDSCFEGPEKKGEVIAPGPEQSTAVEAQAAVKAMASLGENKPRKKGGHTVLYIALALIIIILAAVVVIYVYRPELVAGLKMPFISAPTPTPAPTATPAPTTSVATPAPTPGLPGGPDLYKNLMAIGPAIDANNSSVIWFTTNHTAGLEGNSLLAKACDLFDYVNGHWTRATSSAPGYAGDSVRTLSGDDRDYSILMASLTRALGMESRVVIAYDGNNTRYYPEIMIATNESSYMDATDMYLRSRYNSTDQAGHTNKSAYWLSMAMGDHPGIRVLATNEYCVNWKRDIEKL